MSSKNFVRKFRQEPSTAGQPSVTPLSRVEDMWSEIFPGRELHWEDWKPVVKSTVAGPEALEYSGNSMSDGEKAALYLAGRVFSAPAGVLIVDEPETHLHTLLAIRIWDLLENERPDIRFVFITHDLSFALSRRNAQYVLANPKVGLTSLGLKADLPNDVAEILLGAASLSFYAKRVVFTEGTITSIDDQIYGAWFNGRDTVVRSVGSCEMVMRCTDGLIESKVASSLSALGIIDGDFHSDGFLTSRRPEMHILKVHEAESLICLPAVVAAVAKHQGKTFDAADYTKKISEKVRDADRHRVIIERWKNVIEPELLGLTRKVSNKSKPVDELLSEVTDVFDQTNWSFSPTTLLEAEKLTVEAATTSEAILRLLPGKALVSVAAKLVGQQADAYKDLIAAALVATEGPLLPLGKDLEMALKPFLPARTV